MSTITNAPSAHELREDMKGYAHTDMVFYRSPEDDLASLERTQWDPIIAWASQKWHIDFALTEGLMPLQQPAEWEKKLSEAIDALSEEAVQDMAILTKILGSPIVAFALYYQAIDIDAAITAGFLEEEHQVAQWGEDDEAREKRDAKKQECREAAKALDSLSSSAKP